MLVYVLLGELLVLFVYVVFRILLFVVCELYSRLYGCFVESCVYWFLC